MPDWLVLVPLVEWPIVVVATGAVLVAVLVLAIRGGGTSRWSWLARAGVVVLLGLAALGPHIGSDRVTYLRRPDFQVVIAIDRTSSMAVRDVAGASRMQRATQDLSDITELVDAPVALVTWGLQARVVSPFTTDSRFLTRTLSFVEAERPVKGVGSSIDRPLDTLARLLEQARLEHPQRQTFVVIVGDGENTVPEPQRSYARMGDDVAGGLVVGYGTEAGGPVPIDPTDPGTQPAYVPDPRGPGPAISRRGEDNLRTVAAELGVDYVGWEDLPTAEQAAAALLPEPREVGTSAPSDVTWAVGLALLALLASELRLTAAALREALRLGRAS